MGRTVNLDSTALASARRVHGGTVVTFRTGERYLVECSKATHRGLLFSDSPGSYYNRVMRRQGKVSRIVAGDVRPMHTAFLEPAG